MQRNALLSLAVVLAALSPTASAEDAPEALKLSLLPSPGKPVRFVQTMAARQTSATAGGKLEIATDLTTELSVEVRERAEDGTWKAVARFGRIHGSVAHPSYGTREVDSQGPLPSDAAGKSLTVSNCALGGSSFDVVLDPGGRVRSVAGIEKAVDATAARLGGDAAIRAIVATVVTEKNVRTVIDYALVVTSLPADPVRPGSAWSDSDVVPGLSSGVELTATYRHEVKEVGPGAVRVVGKGGIDIRTVASQGASARMAALVEKAERRTTTASADCRLSAADGLPLAATSEIHLDLGLKDPKGERSIGDMKQDVTFRLERVEKWPSETAATPSNPAPSQPPK